MPAATRAKRRSSVAPASAQKNKKNVPATPPPSQKKKKNVPATPPSSLKKRRRSGRNQPAKVESPAKEESEEDEEMEEAESSEEESGDEESGSDGDDSESDDEMKDVSPKPLVKSSTKGGSSEEESDSAEEESGNDDDDDDSDDENNKKGFTDENADWLKPKKSEKMQLMSSDEEGDDDDEFGGGKSGSDDDDEEDEEEEELLDVERQSRMIDAEMETERIEAEAELQLTISQQTSVYHLPTKEELDEDESGDRVVPPSELRARIEDVLEVLADFKSRREPGRSRSEYVERLSADMAELFGCLDELVEYFLMMLGPAETFEFLEVGDKPRPLVVRTNTLKARRKDLAAALMKRGVRLDPLAPWSKVGLKIYESNVPVGATPEYLAGHYILQSAASMCPVMALGPQPGDRVLDMSAAPGGKTSYIAQLMRNKGVIIANDLKQERQKATVANLHRLGVTCAVTCCFDGRKLGPRMKNSFDRVLLDAPCSGLGVISRDPSVKVQRTMADVYRCGHLQKELLLAAVDSLNAKSKKGGGFMVYSTCSVAVAENEEVVNYLLSKRDVKIVDAGLDFGKPGFTRFQNKRFHPSMALTRRFYPHVHNMDGFYVCKIQKLSDKRKDEAEVELDENGNIIKTPKADSDKKKKKKGAKADDEKKDKKEEVEEKKEDKMKSKFSKPPVKTGGAKKKKTHAKNTKPRRLKPTQM